MFLAQLLGTLTDLALPRQEHQHVTLGGEARHLVDGIRYSLREMRRLDILSVLLNRPIAHFNWVQTARHLDDRCIVEMMREALGVNSGRSDEELELGAPWKQPLDVAEQEVDVEAAFVCLVQDDGVVGVEETVGL